MFCPNRDLRSDVVSKLGLSGMSHNVGREFYVCSEKTDDDDDARSFLAIGLRDFIHCANSRVRACVVVPAVPCRPSECEA